MAGANPMTDSPKKWEWGAVAGIFFFALALRLCNLQQIFANDPFFELPAVDPLFYHRWALRIAAGDWLGEGVFLQGPLYPYLLGILYRLFGSGFLLPRLLQCLLGSVTCVLVWRLARELFDRRVALLAGVMTAVYSTLIFYEGSLLIANILSPINLLLLVAAHRAYTKSTPAYFLVFGLLVGLSSIARPNMLLYAPFAVIWLFYILHRQHSWSRRTALAVTFCAGLLVCIVPSAIRNYAVSGDAVLVSASAGMNFYNGNNPAASGIHTVPPLFDPSEADDPVEQNRIYKAYAERALGRQLSASEVSDYWFAQGLEYVRAQPGAWLRLMGKKFLLFINAFEPWNVRSYVVSSQFSWVLRLPLLTFGIMAPLSFLGLIVTSRSWRQLMPLYAIVGVHFATCLIFFVLARYRIPVVPVLLIFAGQGALFLFDAVRRKRIRSLVLAVAVLALSGVVAHIELEKHDLAGAYYNLGNKYLKLNMHELAIEQYSQSIAVNQHYIPAHYNLAMALERSGNRREEAIAAWRRVLEMSRNRGMTRYTATAIHHLRILEGGERR